MYVWHTRKTWQAAETALTLLAFRTPGLPFGNVLTLFQRLRVGISHWGIIFSRFSANGKYLQKKSMKRILLTSDPKNLVSKDKLPPMTVFATAHRQIQCGASSSRCVDPSPKKEQVPWRMDGSDIRFSNLPPKQYLNGLWAQKQTLAPTYLPGDYK